MTGPTREAGEALRSGSGIVYPLQPRFHRPDTRITVDAALSGASHLPTPGPATHCSGDWKSHPVPEVSCGQKTRF